MTVLRRVVVTLLLLAFVLLALEVSPPTAGRPAIAAETDPVGVWPLRPEPEVVRGFDPPDVVWAAGHRGVDLLGTPGQAVRAALPGSVTYAGRLAGRGVVVVSHGSTRTTYEPVTATVEVGLQVTSGSVLGHLELAGSHCAPRACLHWGWLRGETYLDPLGLVGAGPVRLLPLWRDEPVTWAATLVPAAPVVRWLGPYAGILVRFAELATRSPPGYALGCACW